MLLNFADSIYEDFAMYKNILKAQYEEKIQEHAFRIWQEINDRLQYVEEFYQQKEAKMRYSFQQQLCDALAILRTNYTKYFQIEEGKTDKGEETLAEKLDRLRAKNDEQAALIACLEEELLNYKTKEAKRSSQYDEDEDIDRELLQEENWELKQQISSLNEKIIRLQENVRRKDKEHTQLEAEISKMQDKRERDMKSIEKLMNNQEILKLELDREKQRVLAKALEVKEAQEAVLRLQESSTSSLQKGSSVEGKKRTKRGGKGGKKAGKIDSKQQREAREAAEREAAAREAAAKEEAEREAAAKAKLLGSKRDLESEVLMLQNEIKRLRKSEEKARLQAQRLEQELFHSSQAWELKFEILRKSLHAIKDEMFLRQSLRQSSKSRRPLHTDRSVPPLHLQTQKGRKDKFSGGSSLYVHYAPLPGINSQTDMETKEGTPKITIDVPGTSEGGSDYEEDFEEAPHVPSPTTPLP